MENGILKWQKSNWTDYEHEFYNLCTKRKWFLAKDEDDGIPYLEPAKEEKKGLYRVYAQGPGLCAVMITAESRPRGGATKIALLRKLIKAKIISGTIEKKNHLNFVNSSDVIVDGDAEAIAVFSIDRLPRAVKTLNLRKQPKKVPTMKEELKSVRELFAKEFRSHLRRQYSFESERVISRLTSMGIKDGLKQTEEYIKENLEELKEEDQERYHDERLP